MKGPFSFRGHNYENLNQIRAFDDNKEQLTSRDFSKIYEVYRSYGGFARAVEDWFWFEPKWEPIEPVKTGIDEKDAVKQGCTLGQGIREYCVYARQNRRNFIIVPSSGRFAAGNELVSVPIIPHYQGD